MRKLPLTIITAFSILLFVFPVFAQEATPPARIRDQAVQERIKTAQERVKERKDKIASREATLKERLTVFKDQHKAQAVERVNKNLNLVNDKRVAAMRKHLQRMSELLNKLNNRVNTAKAGGKDVSEAQAAMASASASMAEASAALDLQADKDYSLSVASESAVSQEAKTARDTLHTDLQNVRKLVVEAKQALMNAFRVAATSLKGIGEK
ncbi:hypothetical protein HYW66_00500 [Candidatus Microgenomates bacterium]|nr:hypothetical protein [Candidatus Microgenomates bacterium]